MNERTHFFKRYISHTLFSKELMFLWCVKDGGRDIYTQREDFFFPYLLPEARGCQRLHLLASSSETTWSAACPSFDCDSLHSAQIWVRGSHHVVSFRLHTWVPWSYYPVYKSQRDSLSKHAGSLGTNRKSMAYVI